jgi:hypothetical protein
MTFRTYLKQNWPSVVLIAAVILTAQSVVVRVLPWLLYGLSDADERSQMDYNIKLPAPDVPIILTILQIAALNLMPSIREYWLEVRSDVST